MTLYEDETAVSASIPTQIGRDPQLEKSLKEDRVHNLLDFLKRPTPIAEFLWTVSDTASTTLTSFVNPTAILSHSMNAQKVAGFTGFKGDMVLRLQVNGTRFQQGRLLLHYLPVTTLLPANRIGLANSNLVFKTQQPRVELDINVDTESVLTIPFVYPLEYYPLLDGGPAVGTFYITVYSPLVSPTGDTNASVMVWAHFENPELVYPTVLAPQGDDR